MRDGGEPVVAATASGTLIARGELATAMKRVDHLLLKSARRAGAEEWEVPVLVGSSTLERAEYFRSFPDTALAVAPDAYVNPAVCFHVYAALAEQEIAPRISTVRSPCARNEDHTSATRLRSFTMREIVFFDAPRQVVVRQRRLAKAALTLARELGIDARLVPASDPFFIADDGKRIFQQLKELKLELRATLRSGEEVALASFNVHEDFFTRRFQIAAEGIGQLHSGCAAYGLERWAAAIVEANERP